MDFSSGAGRGGYTLTLLEILEGWGGAISLSCQNKKKKSWEVGLNEIPSVVCNGTVL